MESRFVPGREDFFNSIGQHLTKYINHPVSEFFTGGADVKAADVRLT
jgi:hypothetical protein